MGIYTYIYYIIKAGCCYGYFPSLNLSKGNFAKLLSVLCQYSC